jgi:hypothetical protein
VLSVIAVDIGSLHRRLPLWGFGCRRDDAAVLRNEIPSSIVCHATSSRGWMGGSKAVDIDEIEIVHFIACSTEGSSGMQRGSLTDLTAFVAVADKLSFRAAASQLGVTPSAL